MKHSVLSYSLLAALAFAFSMPAAAQDGTVEEKARALMEKYKSALVVVSVQVTLKATTSGDPLPENVQQRRTLGVTIGDDGLVVVSNSAIDSSVGLAGQQAQLDDKVVTIQSATATFDTVEISYGDETLLPGKVVHRDEGADVAFVMPDAAKARETNKTFDKVDLSQFAATADAADQVVGLSRSSSVYGYMPTIVVGRITGVFKGERTFFVTDAGTAQGIPVFTLDGKPVGITVVRVIDGSPSGVLGTLSAGSIQVLASMARDSAN